jgi:hypothetical protein
MSEKQQPYKERQQAQSSAQRTQEESMEQSRLDFKIWI